MKYSFVVNPISGKGRWAQIEPTLIPFLQSKNIECEILKTKSKEDPFNFAKNISENTERLFIAGGDGTINGVINGLEKQIPVGLIPLGTANVVAKEFHIPMDPNQLCHYCISSITKKIDLGTVLNEKFALVAGIGLDSKTTKILCEQRTGNISMLDYAGPIIKALIDNSLPPLKIIVDGKEIRKSPKMIMVSNLKHYAGPLVITSDAQADDGFLHLCLFYNDSIMDLVRFGIGALLDCLKDNNDVKFIPAKHISITGKGTLPLQIDGDFYKDIPANTTIDFNINPGALEIVIPPDDISTPRIF